MRKSDMIRDVCKHNMSMTNEEIKQAVRIRYKTTVETNLIIATVGSEKDRHVLANTEGHIKWATMLKEYIDANNLRTI